VPRFSSWLTAHAELGTYGGGYVPGTEEKYRQPGTGSAILAQEHFSA